jgi:hypothetical protein
VTVQTYYYERYPVIYFNSIELSPTFAEIMFRFNVGLSPYILKIRQEDGMKNMDKKMFSRVVLHHEFSVGFSLNL